jgi:hypothetical protein
MKVVGLVALVVVVAAVGSYIGIELWFRDTTSDVGTELNEAAALEPEAEDGEVVQAEAVEIAVRHAKFVPCGSGVCRQVRYIVRGAPERGYWAVVLTKGISPDGTPTQTAAFLIDAATGATSTP